MADETRCGCGESLMGGLPLSLNFSTFVLSLGSSALVHLGEAPDPESGKVLVRPELAKHTIDILVLIQDKTRGNLTAEEEKVLCDMLFNLRMKYVNKVK